MYIKKALLINCIVESICQIKKNKCLINFKFICTVFKVYDFKALNTLYDCHKKVRSLSAYFETSTFIYLKKFLFNLITHCKLKQY